MRISSRAASVQSMSASMSACIRALDADVAPNARNVAL
jgi:hypothetical protein